MGTSLVAKPKNAEFLIKLITIEDDDDLVKEVQRNIQKQITDPLVCNENVAEKLQRLVKQYAKGTSTSVGQMEKLKILLQLVTVVASFPKDNGLLALLQHGLLFTVSEIILAAVQCVKGPRSDEAMDLFQEAMKTIRVMSDHSQKANEMVCEHYFHRITQLVTSEKFVMLRNEALNTVKYFLMGCPERVRVFLEVKPKVKSYVEKLGLMLKNTTDMNLQTEIIKVLSLLMVKVDRKNVAKPWFDFDDDLDDFLQILSNASNLDSAISSFLHKFNCITYCSPLPTQRPPVFKEPGPVVPKLKQPAKFVQPEKSSAPKGKALEKDVVTKEKTMKAKEKDVGTKEKAIATKAKDMGIKEKDMGTKGKIMAAKGKETVPEEVTEIQCIPESEQDNLDDQVSAVPESQMLGDPKSPEQPNSQQSAKSNSSASKRKVKASVSESAVHVVISPQAGNLEDPTEPAEDELDNPDVVAGTPDVCGSMKKTRPTFITPKASKSSVILINRNQNTSMRLSPEDNSSLEPVADCEAPVVEESQQVIPDSNPVVERADAEEASVRRTRASQEKGSQEKAQRKISRPIQEETEGSQEYEEEKLSQSVQGSQGSMEKEKFTGEGTEKAKKRRGRKRRAVNRSPTERQTRRSAKEVEQSQIPATSESVPAADELQNERSGRSKRKGKTQKQVEVTGGREQMSNRREKWQEIAVEVMQDSYKKNQAVSENNREKQKKKTPRRSRNVATNESSDVCTQRSVYGSQEDKPEPVKEVIKEPSTKIPTVSQENTAEKQGPKKTPRTYKKVVTNASPNICTPSSVYDFQEDMPEPVKKVIEKPSAKKPAVTQKNISVHKETPRTYKKVVTSVSPNVCTPGSVYDFQEDMPDPVKETYKSTKKPSNAKVRSTHSPMRSEGPSQKRKGRKKIIDKKTTKSSRRGDRPVRDTRNNGCEESFSSDDQDKAPTKEYNHKETAKETATTQKHLHREQVTKKRPKSKGSVMREDYLDDVEIEVMDSAPPGDDNLADVSPMSPVESIESDTVRLISPVAREANDHVAENVGKTFKKPTKNSRKGQEERSCARNVQQVKSKKQTEKANRGLNPIENISSETGFPQQSDEETNSNAVPSEQQLADKEIAKPNKNSRVRPTENSSSSVQRGQPKEGPELVEEERQLNKDATPQGRKKEEGRSGKRKTQSETPACDLRAGHWTKDISKRNNQNAEEHNSDSDVEEGVDSGAEDAGDEATPTRHKRKAAKKVKSYAEVDDIQSFSQDSVDVDSFHLSQADYINARIDTPCPTQSRKKKKSVLIAEKENAGHNLSQVRKQGLLWSVKKKPAKGYDKTYSRQRMLVDRINIYDYSKHAADDEDNFSDQNVPSPIPSPPRKKSAKTGARKTKTNTTNKAKGQKQKSQGDTSSLTMDQMDQMLQECRKSLAVERFSDEEAETRPSKMPRMDDSLSDENDMKTPVKSKRKGSMEDDDSIEIARRSPFPTPYLVDASPDLPLFNRDQFMAEMRSLIQISDESSRADPSLSLHDSPLVSQPPPSPVETNSTGGSHKRNKAPYAKTPHPIKKKMTNPVPAYTPLTREDSPEREASPYQETWTTPMTEMPQSPDPTSQLLCPEIPQFEDEDETGDDEQDIYSSINLGRITPGISQSGGYQFPSINTPLPDSPVLSDKEEGELEASITEEIDNFSYNIKESLNNTGKGNGTCSLQEMSKILQDEIKHAEEELLHVEQYMYMFVAFYENLRKRMFRLKQFQMERIQRLEEVLLKLSGPSTAKESPMDAFEIQIKKLGQLFRSSFSPPREISRK